jgi:hypothetical protein
VTIDDKIYDRFLNTIRDGEADVGTIDIRIDGRWQTIDFRPALARLVAERDDAIAQMNDADSATDNATQIAERVVRELRQEYVDVIDRLEKQSAAREATLRDQIDSLVEAADAARLLLLFAAGPHEAGAVPAMLAAAIERAKGKKP